MAAPIEITPEQKAQMVALANQLADAIDLMGEKQSALQTAALAAAAAEIELSNAVFAYINIKDALETLLPQKDQLPK